MVLKHIIVSVMAVQKSIIYNHNAAIMMMAFFFIWEQGEGGVEI
jgi:hypothetical protein